MEIEAEKNMSSFALRMTCLTGLLKRPNTSCEAIAAANLARAQ